jgi:hypothetical protein
VSGDEPTSELIGTCAKHWTERAAGRCDDCGDLWCATCLVPPARRRQPTRCVECALIAAGVRTRGGRRTAPLSMSRAQKRPTKRW